MALAGVGILVGLGVGISAFFVAANTVSNESEKRLESVAYQHAYSIENLFTNIKKDIIVTANSPLIADTIVDFTQAWNALGGNQQERLQEAYIQSNPFAAGEKHKLNSAGSGSDYDQLHGRLHTVFRKQMEQREYYDIFLFDNAGNLIYSVFKELDYATNFMAGGGKWADTDLGVVFRAASRLDAGEITFTDFKPYAPSYDAPASFMASPVFDAAQQRVGVLALQMPISRINEVMNAHRDLGETGEAYLVGVDGLLRNNSYRTGEDDILARVADATALEIGFSNAKHVFTAPGLLGAESLVATQQAAFADTKWLVVAEQDLTEVNQPLNNMLKTTSLIGTLLVMISTFGAFWFSRGLTRPITQMTDLMGELANGHFDVEVDGQSRRDELGDMARAVEVFRENGLRVLNKRLLSLSADVKNANRRCKNCNGRLVRLLTQLLSETFPSGSKLNFPILN